MIFTRTIGGHHIVAECAAMLEPAVSDIFKTFEGLARSGKMLHAGYSVRLQYTGEMSIPSTGRSIASATGTATRPFPTASSTTGP